MFIDRIFAHILFQLSTLKLSLLRLQGCYQGCLVPYKVKQQIKAINS